MLLEMFINELSLTPAAADVLTGQERLRQLIITMRDAVAMGVKRVLHLPEDFFYKHFAPDYNWYNWLSDNRVDIELRRYFRSLTTKSPFFLDEPNEEALWGDIDCFWQNKKTLGLKAAYVADGLAFSVLSQSEWDNYLIECDIHEIIDDDVSCRIESIHHASRNAHLGSQLDWIQNRIQKSVADGRALWLNIGGFFPSLRFCSVVEDQMGLLPNAAIASISGGLFHLNVYCMGWQSGGFDPSGIGCNVSPESESTLQKYGEERTFLCPDGVQRTFSWHAKVGKWRIYFDPTPGPERMLVGYVGKHLRTVEYN